MSKNNKLTVRIIFSTLLLCTIGIFWYYSYSATVSAQEGPGLSVSLECAGEIIGYFTTVENIGSTHEVIEHKVVLPDGSEQVVKLPGRLHWSDITLGRGVTQNAALWDWRKEVEDGQVEVARKDCSILLLDRNQSPIRSWSISRAWPSAIKATISENGLILEEVVLTHEGYTSESDISHVNSDGLEIHLPLVAAP